MTTTNECLHGGYHQPGQCPEANVFEREAFYDELYERQVMSVLDHAETIDDSRTLADLDFEPRTVEICPDCGSGHTTESRIWRDGEPTNFCCTECGARWTL
jgi:DNA-directed RNA polymerase subunit M/transcription elongation factor TFIIS